MNDYLWNGSGPPDPRVTELEERLSLLKGRPQPLPDLPERRRDPSGPRWAWRSVLLLAASVAVAVIGLSVLLRPRTWAVTCPEEPSMASAMRAGQWLDAGARRARLTVGDLGEVGLEPGTRVRLLSLSPTDSRIELERGTIHALISAPPRRFSVETRAATAIDLGCAYTLSVDEEGNGLLEVSTGWVSLVRGAAGGADEVAVPAGASARLHVDRQPGAPVLASASPAFREALELLDGPEDLSRSRVRLLETLLFETRRRDAVSLLALSPRLTAGERAAVWDRLLALNPRVAATDRARFASGDRDALAALRTIVGVPVP